MNKIWHKGIVIKGNQNGRKMGYPTANILIDNPSITIETGIYAVNIKLFDKHYHGMLYVGTRPTLNLSALSIEIHIFSFNSEIYGEEIEFQILRKFYEDRKFSSIEELIEHIERYNREIIQFFNE